MYHADAMLSLSTKEHLWQHLDTQHLLSGLISGAITELFAITLSFSVAALIFSGTLACGTVYWLLGRLRLGSLVRCMPYPVIGGFLAATGWILVAGGIAVCASLPVDAHSAAAWFAPGTLTRWLPGLEVGLLLFVVSRRCRHYLVLPSLLIAIAVAFFLILLATEGLDIVVRRFDTLDQAVEWCENDLLQASGGGEPPGDLVGQLRAYIDSDEMVQRLLGYLTRRYFAASQTIIRQGAPAEELLFLECGQMTVQLDGDDGATIRVRTLRPGSVVGEMDLYSNKVRSASVVADTEVVVHSLDRAALARIEREAPALANALHRAVITITAERLADSTTLVRALTL